MPIGVAAACSATVNAAGVVVMLTGAAGAVTSAGAWAIDPVGQP